MESDKSFERAGRGRAHVSQLLGVGVWRCDHDALLPCGLKNSIEKHWSDWFQSADRVLDGL